MLYQIVAIHIYLCAMSIFFRIAFLILLNLHTFILQCNKLQPTLYFNPLKLQHVTPVSLFFILIHLIR